MRICLISREFPPDTGWGGIATFVHDLALGLAETGHDVEVIALAADDREDSIAYEGVLVHRVRWSGLLSDRQRFLTAMPYSHNILKQITPLWQKFLSIQQVKPFDVVEVPEMFGEGVFVALSKIAPLVVRLYTPHFKFIDEGLHNINASFDHQFIALLERLTILKADVVSSPSEDLADYICRDLNYPRQNLPIVRDPVNTARFRPDGPKALDAGGNLTVLFAGRLEARKGVYYLMQAIPKVVSVSPNVRFVMLGRDTNTAAGNKSVLAELKGMLNASGAGDRVTFIPGVPNSEMPSYFRSADICVLPSLYDNAPFTCIEALSSGRPVIGTSAGGMKEYIVHGQSGLIVPPADADALAQALIELIADDSKRQTMGEYARRYVLENFDRKLIAQQSIGLYKLAQANFAGTREHALFRHAPETLLPFAVDLIASYEKMLYDLLYLQSWRFRLTHWFYMFKDRPRLSAARAAAKVLKSLSKLASRDCLPPGLAWVENAVAAKQGSREKETAPSRSIH